MPNAAARLPDSPGNRRADPGWPGPRRPARAAIAASAPVVPDRAPFAAARASASVTSRISATSPGVSSSSPGGGGPSGSAYSSGPNGSARSSSQASRSSSVIGSGRVTVGSQPDGSYSAGSPGGSGELAAGPSFRFGRSVGRWCCHLPFPLDIDAQKGLVIETILE